MRNLRDNPKNYFVEWIMSIAVVGSLFLHAAEASEHWYDRDECKRVVDEIFSSELATAEGHLISMEQGEEPELNACGAWGRLLLSENKLSLYGRTPELLKHREQMLNHLYGFSKSHAKFGPTFRDLEFEARIRRLRVLLDKGDRTTALSEARRLNKILESNPSKSATFDYVRGVVYLAVAQEAWPLRTLLSMAGVVGDEGKGRESLKRLIDGDTAYKYEAMYVMRHFASEKPGGKNGQPAVLSKLLHERYPKNPQFVYDYGLDLRQEQKCLAALTMSEPARAQLKANHALFSPTVRAKIFWFTGRCAKDSGNLSLAKEYVELADKESFPDLEDQIEDLKNELN